MTIDELKHLLLWCTLVNYGVLLVWFGAFTFAHDGMFRLHTRWFRISRETFDGIHYGAMAVYKIGVLPLNLVPLAALHFAH